MQTKLHPKLGEEIVNWITEKSIISHCFRPLETACQYQ